MSKRSPVLSLIEVASLALGDGTRADREGVGGTSPGSTTRNPLFPLGLRPALLRVELATAFGFTCRYIFAFVFVCFGQNNVVQRTESVFQCR